MSTDATTAKTGYGLMPTDIAGFDRLVELALDMRSSWNHATDAIWRELDAELWSQTHNPWVVLQTASRARIERVLTTPALRTGVDGLVRSRRAQAQSPAWFQQAHAPDRLGCVAYFCMEFMLSEALPIYSGGLGNVAGDQLKACSDLGVPVVGVGLLYQQGYFRQVIDRDGAQQALFPYNDPAQLPIAPVRTDTGEWLRIALALPGHSVWLRAWQVEVGRVKLYLLDSNDAANLPAHRGITSELYGGGPELRLAQELVLGIGGWRLLRALGLQPEVCHLNEGHAAFAVLERARDFMRANEQPFDIALAATRAGNLFTTHTAVAAGFDRFAPTLIEQYLGAYAEHELGLSTGELLGLGRRRPDDADEAFNMAYLAIHGSGAVNGVSRLHGEVSRRLFEPLFPGWPAAEIPIGHVTNGVHMPTWDSAPADALWTEACGKDRWLGPTEGLEQRMRGLGDAALWQFRTAARVALVDQVRTRLALQLSAAGAPHAAVEQAGRLFDPDVLTLGFARRFATYKRPNLLLHDRERLQRLLSDSTRPVQLVIAGKAHPEDRAGQALIRRMDRFHPRDAGPRPRRLPRRLRHAVDGAARAGCGCLDQHAAATVGSQRHQRHEGARQWRHQPLRARRLVGRGLHARRGLGARRRGRARRRSALGRARGRGALRPARAPGDRRVLRPQRAGSPARVAGTHSREHGPADAALLREPCRARIHRALLSAARDGLPRSRGPSRRRCERARAVAGRADPDLAGAALR